MTKLPDPEDALRKIQGQPAPEEDDLPAQTTFEIDVAGRRGKRFEGKFRYAVPTVSDQIQIGALKSVYLPNGAAADPNAASLAEVIAYLTVCIKFDEVAFKKPKWWNPLAAYDVRPYQELFRRCLDYEAKFHGEGEDSRHMDESPSEPEDEPGSDPAHVGRKVQAPPERRETLAGDGA